MAYFIGADSPLPPDPEREAKSVELARFVTMFLAFFVSEGDLETVKKVCVARPAATSYWAMLCSFSSSKEMYCRPQA